MFEKLIVRRKKPEREKNEICEKKMSAHPSTGASTCTKRVHVVMDISGG